MTTTKILSKTIITTAALVLWHGTASHAANLVNTGTAADGAGELFVGFHATGGQGNGQSVVVDLGATSPYAAVARGGTLVFVVPSSNVGAELRATFGNTWYERPDLLWSAVSAVQSTVPSTSTDPTNTLYGSVASSTFNPSSAPSTTPWNRGTLSGQSSIAQRVISNMATSAAGSGSFTDSPQGSASNIAVEAANATQGYATWMPGGSNVSTGLGNTPFGGYGTAGFEQAFSIGSIGSGAEGALDVYRMNRSTASDPEASPTTGTGAGSYQFTLTIDQTGAISGRVLPVPEPASIALLATGGILFLSRRSRGRAGFPHTPANT